MKLVSKLQTISLYYSKFLDLQPDQQTLAPPIVRKECKYEKLGQILADKDKGKMLDLHFGIAAYGECESKCDNHPDCMNFEFCPNRKICRLFDGEIQKTGSLEQKQWYNCFTSYATCKKGNLMTVNIVSYLVFN